ncbi:AtpZ/AtpI family protein [Nocardioidaceae bacterium SCSIO 66511]|nr:AtpZ/AtpI family protein [Nocardioidaceae bacterium SCSIO 66511]
MSEPSPERRSVDPWAAVGRIGGGVLFYGAIGYLLDRWWGTSFMVAIGVVLGAALGIYTVFATLRNNPED